jgi:AraC-like DNA-binding protein
MKSSSSAPSQLSDVTLHSPKSRIRGVKALQVENRPWIDQFQECPSLSRHQILHVGIMETEAPTRIVRTKQTTAYFLACLEGKGRVLIDGRWRMCKAGQACLLPAHTLNAFEAVANVPWHFCWVCYQQPDGQRLIADAASPILVSFEAVPLHSAILGLQFECGSVTQPDLIHHWVELIHGYVSRFARPLQHDDQLQQLWLRVATRLGDDWNLALLAKEAGYSNEHLRRLCHRYIGRSPMHQVTYMRMRHAAELLVSTDLTIESIASSVGYHSPFVFSNAFTKWIGWRPSEYRRKTLKGQPPTVAPLETFHGKGAL